MLHKLIRCFLPRSWLLCALLLSRPSGAHAIELDSYCGSEVCDEKTEQYCIVNVTHHYAAYEGPLHCKFGSNKLKLWVKSTGAIQCSAPCLEPDAYEPYDALACGCSISLTFPMGVWLDPNAVIQAAVVNVSAVQGRITVMKNASIRSDGLGQCGRAESRPYEQGYGMGSGGAGHAGGGGACQNGNGRTGAGYGDATSPNSGMWEQHGRHRVEAQPGPFFGSGTYQEPQTNTTQARCCGGGVIALEAGPTREQGVQLDGTISADGQPPRTPGHPHPQPESSLPCANLGGAAGGTVILHVDGKVPFVNGTGGVFARGADADQASNQAAGGGSGGRVHMPTYSPQVEVDARGGAGSQKVPGQCQAGAAGSIFFLQGETYRYSLHIANGMTNGATGAAASTLIRRDGITKAPQQPALPIYEAIVRDGAVLSLGQYPQQNLTIRYSLELSAYAELALGYMQSLIVPELELFSSTISSTELSQQSSTSLHVSSLSLDTLSSISGLALANISKRASIEGRVISSNPLTFNVRGGQLNVRTLGYVAAYSLVVLAESVSVQGKVQATAGAKGPFSLNCTAPVDYPMQFHVVGSLEVSSGGVLASGGILICTDLLNVVFGTITSQGIGLAAGTGEGAGSEYDEHSPGSGGGHAGEGGRSGGFKTNDLVLGGGVYGHDWEPGNMGSGGGGGSSSTQRLGGNGGGVIHVSATSLYLSRGAVINSNGGSGANAPMVISSSKPVGGGGGGAGGSILLATQNINTDGDGSITANGGSGGKPAGGGGGGGRVHVRPKYDQAEPGTDSWHINNAVLMDRLVKAANGPAADCNANICNGTRWQAHPGQNGTKTGPDCAAGDEAMLCQPCTEGFCKAWVGPGDCEACDAGKYADAEGKSACAECEPGHSASTGGMATCVICEAGQYAATFGMTSCAACPAGTVSRVEPPASPLAFNQSSESGGTVCTACPPHMAAVSPGSKMCNYCALGSYPNQCPSTKAVAGAECKHGSSECVACSSVPCGFRGATPGCKPESAEWTGPLDSPDPCHWECNYSFFTSYSGRKCGPVFEQVSQCPPPREATPTQRRAHTFRQVDARRLRGAHPDFARDWRRARDADARADDRRYLAAVATLRREPGACTGGSAPGSEVEGPTRGDHGR